MDFQETLAALQAWIGEQVVVELRPNGWSHPAAFFLGVLNSGQDLGRPPGPLVGWGPDALLFAVGEGVNCFVLDPDLFEGAECGQETLRISLRALDVVVHQ